MDRQKFHDTGPAKSKNIPRHVAIIMDGNGRWAQERGRPRVWGHKNGVESVRNVVEAAAELGVEVLTLYAFSEENWERPKQEVSAILGLLDWYVEAERQNLKENNVRFNTIGYIEKLPVKSQKLLADTKEYLASCTGLLLNVALSYGARKEMVVACQSIAKKVVAGELAIDQITPSIFEEQLSTSKLPDPDLLIRTSGEHRLSNFLLWQMAYTELYFTPTYWPDFRKSHFYEAIDNFKTRKRRFGKIEEAMQC